MAEDPFRAVLDAKYHDAHGCRRPDTEQFRDLPGLRMHIREAGAGEPIFLVHGFPESSREYARVIPLLAGGARVIAPDLRRPICAARERRMRLPAGMTSPPCAAT